MLVLVAGSAEAALQLDSLEVAPRSDRSRHTQRTMRDPLAHAVAAAAAGSLHSRSSRSALPAVHRCTLERHTAAAADERLDTGTPCTQNTTLLLNDARESAFLLSKRKSSDPIGRKSRVRSAEDSQTQVGIAPSDKSKLLLICTW